MVRPFGRLMVEYTFRCRDTFLTVVLHVCFQCFLIMLFRLFIRLFPLWLRWVVSSALFCLQAAGAAMTGTLNPVMFFYLLSTLFFPVTSSLIYGVAQVLFLHDCALYHDIRVIPLELSA